MIGSRTALDRHPRPSTATSRPDLLPLFAALDRIDRSHLEAGATSARAPGPPSELSRFPSKVGILGGAVLITLPMFGDYYTPDIVSGAPQTSLLGNQIDLYFHYQGQPTIGAALTVILAAFLTIPVVYYDADRPPGHAGGVAP